jgi:putative tricarboxylic transport membrane protein
VRPPFRGRMEKKMKRESLSSLVWLFFGVLICLGSVRLSLGDFRNPGPGFLPFITGAILTGLSLIVFLQSRRTAEAGETPKPFLSDKKRATKAFLTLFALLAYAIGMDYLGFLVSTTVFIAFLLGVVEPQKWYVVVFGSLLSSGVSYTLFEILLQSPLPKGIFEF